MPWSRIKTDYIEPDFYDKEITGNRRLTYAESLNEALSQALELDPNVFVMGQGVDDPSGMFGSTKNLQKKFGVERVFDTPLAETALTGIATGAAMAGMKPIYFHNRPDFLYLALDQIANHAAKWSFMFAGKVSVPLVIWACIGRGWGSGAQHSQALQSLFLHIPGLKLVMPASCYDAKGLMLTAIKDPNPVIVMDHRMNFRNQGYVPEKIYTIPFGKGIKRREGADVTIVAISHMVTESLLAAEELFAKNNIDAEVIDPRTLCPLDEELILGSVSKTGHLVVVDMGWKTGGVAAEIASLVADKGFSTLKAPIKRVTCPDIPTPAGYTLENAFYIGKNHIKDTVLKTVSS